MGSTNNAAADTAVKNMTNTSDLPANVEEGFFDSPLTGSVGFGGDNNPDDVFKVSEALVANDRLDQPTSIADDAFNSRIITAQQDMAGGLKPDGLINPGGPTESRFTNLVQGGLMKDPVEPVRLDHPTTGSRVGNAQATALNKLDDVGMARAKALQNTTDPDRTPFQQAQDVKRLNNAKDDAAAAIARAEHKDIKQREKAQHDQVMAVQKARQQTAQQNKQAKDSATKAANGVANLLKQVSSKQTERHSGAGQNQPLAPEAVDPRDDANGVASDLSQITDEVFSANQRTAQYLASRDGIGDLPKFIAEGIEADGDKAIAETIDLIQQTEELSPEQANRLYERVAKELNPKERNSLDQALNKRSEGPHKSTSMTSVPRGLSPLIMDDQGRVIRDGKPVPRESNPLLHKAQMVPVAPAPVPGVPPVPGGMTPATPQEIDTALSNATKTAREAWDELKDRTGVTDGDLYQTPLGQMLLTGKMTGQGLDKLMDGVSRTDIAEPQPPVPGIPIESGIDLPHDTKGRSTEPDQVIDPPEFVPPPTDAETDNQPFPDQSDDPDINGATLLDMSAPGPRDFILTKEDKLDFGEIPVDVEKVTGGRFPAKPIRVQRGEPGGGKWGLRHVESDPKKPIRIKKLGYKDERDMIEDVASGYSEIYEQKNGSLLLLKPNGQNRYAVVRLTKAVEGEYYGATTWFPEDSNTEPNYLSRLERQGRVKKIWP